MAHELLEPFGSPALDGAVARLIAHLVSLQMPKDAPRVRVSDFVPQRADALREYLAAKDEEGEGV